MSASMCRLPATAMAGMGSAARASCQAVAATQLEMTRQRNAAATRRSMNAAPRPNWARLTYNRRGGSVSDYVGIWGIVASGSVTMIDAPGPFGTAHTAQPQKSGRQCRPRSSADHPAGADKTDFGSVHVRIKRCPHCSNDLRARSVVHLLQEAADGTEQAEVTDHLLPRQRAG